MNNYKYIDLSYLISMADGNVQILKEIVEIFRVEMPKNIEIMEECISEKNYKSLSEIAHKSKSSVKIVGMTRLSEKLKDVEYSAKKEENIESYIKTLEYFKTNFNGAILELDNFISKL